MWKAWKYFGLKSEANWLTSVIETVRLCLYKVLSIYIADSAAGFFKTK